jgi:hypothetical protein
MAYNIKIQNYKTYLLANGIKDSREAFRAYCDEFVFDKIGIKAEGIKQQYVQYNWAYRFCND